MTNFAEKMRLKGQADEDCYFARRDRELIEQRRARRALPLRKIVSGGQSGVDRAALDVAISRGLAVGGWCPKGRWAEDGPIPVRYPLQEAQSADPAERTERNLRDSDATLVIYCADLVGGTRLTVDLAHELNRPLQLIDLARGESPGPIRDWLRENGVQVLNVAGPRESESIGIGVMAAAWLHSLLAKS